MAGPKITLTFAGDESQLSKTFGDVGTQADGLEPKVGGASESLGKLGDSSARVGKSAHDTSGKLGEAGEATEKWRDRADELDTKAMGFRDTMTGVQDSMGGVAQIAQGNLFTGFLTLGMGVGDLGSAFYNTLIPALSGLGGLLKTTVIPSILETSAALLTSPITWIVVGIGLIVAAIVLMVTHWQTVRQVAGEVLGWLGSAFAPVRDAAVAAFNFIHNAVVSVFSWVKSNWPLLLSILGGPIGAAAALIITHWNQIKNGAASVLGWLRSAFSSVGSAVSSVGHAIMNAFKTAFDFVATGWNSTIGSISFHIPSWVPGIGGAGFSVPKIPLFDNGGTVPGAPGSHTLAMLQAGETVLATQSGGMTLQVSGSAGSGLDALFLDWLREKVRKGQLALVPS